MAPEISTLTIGEVSQYWLTFLEIRADTTNLS